MAAVQIVKLLDLEKLGSLVIPIVEHTPTSSTDTGVKGTIAYDANYLYICTATNTWKRIALTW